MSQVLTLLLALTLPLWAAAPEARPHVLLTDLDNRPVDPFLAGENASAIVFLFSSVDCPVSNRYAPVVQRLHATFASQGVAFWLIYPNPSETAGAIREHLKAFRYPVHALRDPKHELVKQTHVSVTPEAAVFARDRSLVYHGRIDNRYVSIGIERPSATRHDLLEALTATLSGGRVLEAETQPVGCFIADFVH